MLKLILTLHNKEAYPIVQDVLFLSIYVTCNVSKKHFKCTIIFLLNSYYMVNS